MNAPFESLSKQLGRTEQRAFERGMQTLNRRWVETSVAKLDELVAVLRVFSEARGLGPTEISRRVRIAVEAAKLPDRQARDLASMLIHLPPTIRQAVTTSLPPQLRQLVYSASQPQPVVGEARLEDVLPAIPALVTHATESIDSPASISRNCSNVILLGTFADHEENYLALERRGFTPLRAMHVDQLKEYLDHEVCGIVVARSWWPGVAEAEREGVLKQILAHSSFAWLKFDTHNLPCSAQRFDELVLAARHVVPGMGECTCHDGWRLTQHDLIAIERIRSILGNTDTVRLCPAEIHETQARVVIGAAIKHVWQRNFFGSFRLTRVETNLIHGGRSYAKIIRMAPDDDGAPLVAKIDVVERLSDEMSRFKRYVQRWDTALNPQLHYHAGTSLIIFGLVESTEASGRPAPTLEDTLETMFYCEHWPDSYQGPNEQELRELIDRAIRKLQRLNSQQNDGGFSQKTYIACEPYKSLRRVGIEWKIGHCDGTEGSVFDFIDTAVSKVDALADRVIVHGDVQLRNILVRDGREPHFIDYANCGPGHPAFDLVRLESAILFYCGRMNGDERETAALLLDILNGHSEAEIAKAHPLFYTCRTNRLALYASIACRAASLETMSKVGGTEDDYLAMKYIIACQSLFMIHLQSGIARSQLAALGAFLRRRANW